MDYKTPAGSSFPVFDLWWYNVALRFTDLIPSLHDPRSSSSRTWSRADFSWGLGLFYDVIFAVDCGWALVGYGLESRWLATRRAASSPLRSAGCLPRATRRSTTSRHVPPARQRSERDHER